MASSTTVTDAPASPTVTKGYGNELTAPGISRIVKVTIACAVIVIIITGLVLAFKIARLIRNRREVKRRRNNIGFIELSGGTQPSWELQGSKKSWGGRKMKNAHKQPEWEGVAA